MAGNNIVQYPNLGKTLPRPQPVTTATNVPVNDYLYSQVEHPGMYFLTGAGLNAQMELDALNKAAAGGWKSPWAADSPFAGLTPQWVSQSQKRQGELAGLLNPTTAQPKVEVPQVTIPPTITQPTANPVSAPTGGVQMPNLNTTTPNTSQDMWDSYSRINAANNGVLTKPPVTGWS